jgi:hypothetical protein
VRLAAALLAALLLLAGCADDDDDAETTPTAPVETETEIETATSPEDQPGGAGDEEPARSQALFTAQDGRVTPRVVRVPAFIAVRVELRARDDGPYVLEIGGQTIEAGGRLSSGSVRLDGLRPGDAYVGTLSGAATGRLRVSATAEPGP